MYDRIHFIVTRGASHKMLLLLSEAYERLTLEQKKYAPAIKSE